MIFESSPWKSDLLRYLRQFQTWSDKIGTQRGGFYVERAVFLSAFIVRKMMENRKVSDAIRDRSIRCTAYPALRPLSDRVSRFFGVSDPSKDYDMCKPAEVRISAYDLMSEIMHSYVFMPAVDDRDRCTGFLVNSYNKQDHRLLSVERIDFERLLADVANDEVDQIVVEHHPVSNRVLAAVQGRARSKARKPRATR